MFGEMAIEGTDSCVVIFRTAKRRVGGCAPSYNSS